MPDWVKPWLCLSALALGLLLSIRPITMVLVAAASNNPAATATIVSAIIGFSGVALSVSLTTKAGFKNLIASQELQSERDREARAHQSDLARASREDDREHQKRVIAAALHGELTWLVSAVQHSTTFMQVNKVMHETAAKDRDLANTEVEYFPAKYRVPVYETNIPLLGVLGPSIAADVVSVFSRAAVSRDLPDGRMMKPKFAALLYEATAKDHREWVDEIIHVGARLSYLQGLRSDDPGTLLAFKRSKTSPKPPAGGKSA